MLGPQDRRGSPSASDSGERSGGELSAYHLIEIWLRRTYCSDVIRQTELHDARQFRVQKNFQRRSDPCLTITRNLNPSRFGDKSGKEALGVKGSLPLKGVLCWMTSFQRRLPRIGRPPSTACLLMCLLASSALTLFKIQRHRDPHKKYTVIHRRGVEPRSTA